MKEEKVQVMLDLLEDRRKSKPKPLPSINTVQAMILKKDEYFSDRLFKRKVAECADSIRLLSSEDAELIMFLEQVVDIELDKPENTHEPLPSYRVAV